MPGIAYGDVSNLPSPASVGYLSTDIADEGIKVDMEAKDIAFVPAPPELLVPDWSKIKPIRKYFNRKTYQVYPCWIYHPHEAARIVNNAEDAARYGIVFRLATPDERARYGIRHAWDFLDNTKWRTAPINEKPQHNQDVYSNVKNLVRGELSSTQQQNALVEALIPQIVAAVAGAMKGSAPSAPANVFSADWDEFLKFQAWRATAAAVAEVGAGDSSTVGNALAGGATADAIGEGASEGQDEEGAGADEIDLWRGECERLGIKVDKRWGLARLQQEVEKVT